jgi:hypothetical protein
MSQITTWGALHNHNYLWERGALHSHNYKRSHWYPLCTKGKQKKIVFCFFRKAQPETKRDEDKARWRDLEIGFDGAGLRALYEQEAKRELELLNAFDCRFLLAISSCPFRRRFRCDATMLGVDESAVVMHDLDEDTTLVLTDLSALTRDENVHSRLLTRAQESNLGAKSQLQILTPPASNANYRHPECYKYTWVLNNSCSRCTSVLPDSFSCTSVCSNQALSSRIGNKRWLRAVLMFFEV